MQDAMSIVRNQRIYAYGPYYACTRSSSSSYYALHHGLEHGSVLQPSDVQRLIIFHSTVGSQVGARRGLMMGLFCPPGLPTAAQSKMLWASSEIIESMLMDALLLPCAPCLFKRLAYHFPTTLGHFCNSLDVRRYIKFAHTDLTRTGARGLLLGLVCPEGHPTAAARSIPICTDGCRALVSASRQIPPFPYFLGKANRTTEADWIANECQALVLDRTRAHAVWSHCHRALCGWAQCFVMLDR